MQIVIIKFIFHKSISPIRCKAIASTDDKSCLKQKKAQYTNPPSLLSSIPVPSVPSRIIKHNEIILQSNQALLQIQHHPVE